MPTFGGLSPFPLRFGGGKPRVKVILDALNADRGDAYNANDRTTVVYVENMAFARAISAAWGTNNRLGSIWDAKRMDVSVLTRWEKILALAPSASDSLAARRAVVGAVLSRFGSPSISGVLTAALSSALGPAFVALEFISYANAYIQVPDGSYPWGVVGSSPWSSSVAHVIVRLQKPTGWSEGDFFNAAAKVFPLLDSALPAYTTFDWYRAPSTGTPVAVSGGPSAAGFYLDEANLDLLVFDV